MTALDRQYEVPSTPDYYQRLEEAALTPLWRTPGTTEPEPIVDEVPHVWRWRDVYPLLNEAAQTVELGTDADRRALNARNPARRFGTSHSLIAGYQMVLPGETAPSHRHTPGAIRFMLEGRGHTVVDGEPVLMEPGDLVLTPGMTWHDHRHEEGEPMVWLDGLDVPFVRAMRAGFYEDHPSGALQPVLQPEGTCTRRYSVGLVPATDSWAAPYSPLTNYKWTTTYTALRDMRETANQPHDDIRMEYVNPLTGGHVLPTMACYAQLLSPGSASVTMRHTSSTVFCVAAGRGHSDIADQPFEWERNDFFVVPPWTWHRHAADEEVVLFSMSDRPLLEPFGLYREERV